MRAAEKKAASICLDVLALPQVSAPRAQNRRPRVIGWLRTSKLTQKHLAAAFIRTVVEALKMISISKSLKGKIEGRGGRMWLVV